MDFRIVSVASVNAQLVIEVDHFRGDALWFREAYVFQGREGDRHKIKTDGNGDPLLTDGQPVIRDADGATELPEGKTWDREAAPHLRLSSVLSVIRRVHAERLTRNAPRDARSPVVGRLQSHAEDVAGIGALLALFAGLPGTEFEA